ncbi:copper amine oxidase N-terminal domain-containing protein [Paenibacillus sp. N4]|uniref:stalk domain-containing protein n=1 Tax=Paenibacillus vietnamensis TaxID=2590547 RepID=UPI001CD17110|nr:stalk domain-containing protein [Paenibacillus vietnamensis]MCA0753721.1 copper amine oxidase N-terminal domain-containing protein [Paenibacillus vietnamensis]
MKKFMFGFILGGLLFGSITATANSSTTGRFIKVFDTVKGIYLDDTKLETDEDLFIYNQRVYVPLRFMIEQTKAPVSWDSKTKTVNLKTPYIINNLFVYLPDDIENRGTIIEGDLAFVFGKGKSEIIIQTDGHVRSEYIDPAHEGENPFSFLDEVRKKD